MGVLNPYKLSTQNNYFNSIGYTVESLLANPPNQGLKRKNLHNKDKNFSLNRCHQYIFNL